MIKQRDTEVLARLMANEDAKLNLHSVLAEVCEALVNIILLAPSEQRDEP
jgi:hypothetical protein